MENIEENGIQMELKYCERCGGLWLRLKGSELAYCPPCAVILAGVARDPRCLQHRGDARCAPNRELELEDVFWSEGGEA
jgi:Zn-finger nucleic acid-binding protein